jgi:DNA-binding CsgD family transcriptional regulator
LTICKKDEWKDIIILRLKGYKEQEIAKILNLSIKKISNEFLSMKKFLKENYF